MNEHQSSAQWTCAACGSVHDGLATVFGPQSPDPWVSATDRERKRGAINRDLCEIKIDGQQHFFIRGELHLPVRDADIDSFVWSVWVSLSAASMRTTRKFWKRVDRVELPPMFGWLSNDLGVYGQPTVPLAANVHTREPGVSPTIELDPTSDHPLAREQRDGIDLHRVAQLNDLLLAT